MVSLFGASPPQHAGQGLGQGQMGYDMGAYQQPATPYGGMGFGLGGQAGAGQGAEMGGGMSMMGSPMGQGMGLGVGMGMGQGMGMGMGQNMMGGGPMGPGAGMGGMGSMSRGLAFGLPQQANGLISQMQGGMGQMQGGGMGQMQGGMGQSGYVLHSSHHLSSSIHVSQHPFNSVIRGLWPQRKPCNMISERNIPHITRLIRLGPASFFHHSLITASQSPILAHSESLVLITEPLMTDSRSLPPPPPPPRRSSSRDSTHHHAPSDELHYPHRPRGDYARSQSYHHPKSQSRKPSASVSPSRHSTPRTPRSVSIKLPLGTSPPSTIPSPFLTHTTPQTSGSNVPSIPTRALGLSVPLPSQSRNPMMYQQSGQWPIGMGGMGQMGQMGHQMGGMGGGGMNMGIGGMGMGNPFAMNQQQQQQQQQGPGLSPGSMGVGGGGGGSASAFTDQQGNELKPFDSGEMKKGRLGHYGYLDGRGELSSCRYPDHLLMCE